VNQFHLFRAERFVDAACQSTAVHFTSLGHPVTMTAILYKIDGNPDIQFVMPGLTRHPGNLA
jgi:hypothetical protein